MDFKFEILFRIFEILFRIFEILFRIFEILFRIFEILFRIFGEKVTKRSIKTKRIIRSTEIYIVYLKTPWTK